MSTNATKATKATEGAGGRPLVASVASVAAREGLSLAIPPELVERIAERAAELIVQRSRAAPPELLTPVEAADYLRCGRQRVYDLLSQGRLRHLKDGARVLIRRADLLAYLDQGMSTRNTKERESHNA